MTTASPTGCFITGTDTGVGKTFVTAGLARAATARGLRVFAFKPIETGCTWRGGRLVGDDQATVTQAAGDWQRDELMGVYQFERPVAPAVAAGAAPIDLDRIAEAFTRGCAQAHRVLVEGAGGWRVPISPQADMAALARRLGLPVLLVARATLGTLNHTLLSVEAILRDGCRLAGVVLSQRATDDRSLAASNHDELRARVSAPVWRVGTHYELTLLERNLWP